MATDIKDFVVNCLLCVISQRGSKLPRPLAKTQYATKANEAIRFDYQLLGKGHDNRKDALVVEYDFSSYLLDIFNRRFILRARKGNIGMLVAYFHSSRFPGLQSRHSLHY